MLDILGNEGPNWTAFDALSTGDTNGFLKRFVTKCAHLEVVTSIGHVNGVNAHDLPAGSNAYTALDTLIGVKIEEGVARVYRKVLSYAT
jgi:hypothetical protein